MTLDLTRIAQGIAAKEHRSMTQSKHGWQQHVLSSTERPPALDFDGYRNRPPAQRAKYDTARGRFHQGLDQIETDQMLSAFGTMDRHLAALLADSSVARPGVILSGEANAGKSTILTGWGRKTEVALRDAVGMPLTLGQEGAPRLDNNAEYLPICYFNLADSVGASLRNALRFYNPRNPVTGRITIDSLIHQLATFVEHCRTSVILMDQVHQIRQANRGPGEVSEAIKQIMDTCTSTVLIGAGIGVEHLRIFSDGNSVGEARLGQTGGRFSMHPVVAYDRYDPASKAAWERLLRTMEQELILLKGQPGDLLGLSEYILDRTEGLTGAVMKLLRSGANEAIANGDERITRQVLRRIEVSAFADIASGHITATQHRGPKQPVAKTIVGKRGPSSHIRSGPSVVP